MRYESHQHGCVSVPAGRVAQQSTARRDKRKIPGGLRIEFVRGRLPPVFQTHLEAVAAAIPAQVFQRLPVRVRLRAEHVQRSQGVESLWDQVGKRLVAEALQSQFCGPTLVVTGMGDVPDLAGAAELRVVQQRRRNRAHPTDQVRLRQVVDVAGHRTDARRGRVRIDVGLRSIVVLIDIAQVDAVLLAGRVVHSRGAVVLRAPGPQVHVVVAGARDGPRLIGQRIVGAGLHRHRVQQGGRNHIVRKRISQPVVRIGRVRPGGERIVQRNHPSLRVQQAAEVAIAFRRRGNAQDLGASLHRLRGLQSHKEMCLVLADRSAQRPAVLIEP